MEGSESLVIVDFSSLSLVKTEMEKDGVSECNDSKEKIQVWHITMSLSVKRIITDFITIWLIVGICFINNQFSVRIWRENVLVAVEIKRLEVYLLILLTEEVVIH